MEISNMDQLEKEYDDLDTWSIQICNKLSGRIILEYDESCFQPGFMVMRSYNVKFSGLGGEVMAKDINDVAKEVGRQSVISIGRRYYWAYDKSRQILLLMFYPYRWFGQEEGVDVDGRPYNREAIN